MPATWPPRAVIRKSAGLRTIESALYRGGLGPVAGVDEVGRGAIAGPVAVGLAVVDQGVGQHPLGLRDSKMLAEKRREDELRRLVSRFVRWNWDEAWSGVPLADLLHSAGLPRVPRHIGAHLHD